MSLRTITASEEGARAHSETCALLQMRCCTRLRDWATQDAAHSASYAVAGAIFSGVRWQSFRISPESGLVAVSQDPLRIPKDNKQQGNTQ